MTSPLSKRYGDEVRWLNWKLEKVNDKLTKIPYYSKIHKASSVDQKTWITYGEACTSLDNGSNGFSGVGIVLHDSKLVCIDIDHVVENGKIIHDQAEDILRLLKSCNSFTEISQSGTGIHIYLELGFEFTPIVKKKAPFEIYTNGRFICVTENSYDNTPKEVRLIKTEDELLKILNTIGYPWGRDQQQQQIIQTTSTNMTDDEVLEKMFNSKKGLEVKELYNGDSKLYENDESREDYALCSMLAFWTGKNAEQIERIWFNSPLGSRKKTQSRKDYRQETINKAIINCKNVYTPRVVQEEFLTQFSKQHGEIIIPCKENVLIALRITDGLSGKLRYNEWTGRKEIFDIDGKWRPFEDNDINLIQSVLANNYKDLALRTASDSFVNKAVLQYSKENSVDPAKEYFESLVWDNVPRLDTWIKNTYNTIGFEKEYATFGTQWLKGLVKRVVDAGCKFDHVLVIEGEQGLKKSTAFKTLGKDWYVEVTISPNNKDFFMVMNGKMIVEFSEGEIQDRASHKLLKSVITTQIDTYRNPYDREVQDRPRRCVFAMTVNDTKYLKDDTGNRRWLPVACGSWINIDWLEENRDQLFAEAYHKAVTLNENLYDGLSTQTIKDMQDARREERFEEIKIVDWYQYRSKEEREEGYSLEEIYDSAIGKGEERINQLAYKVTGSVVKNVLKLKEVRRVKDGKRKTLYIATEETYKSFPVEEQGDLFTLPKVEINF